jgi:hypothetical protein
MAKTIFQATGALLRTSDRIIPRAVPCIATVKRTSPCNIGPRNLRGAI